MNKILFGILIIAGLTFSSSLEAKEKVRPILGTCVMDIDLRPNNISLTHLIRVNVTKHGCYMWADGIAIEIADEIKAIRINWTMNK